MALSNQQSFINGWLSAFARQHADETLSGGLGLQQLPPTSLFIGSLGVRSPTVEADSQIGTDSIISKISTESSENGSVYDNNISPQDVAALVHGVIHFNQNDRQQQQQQQTLNAMNHLRALIVAEEVRKQQRYRSSMGMNRNDDFKDLK